MQTPVRSAFVAFILALFEACRSATQAPPAPTAAALASTSTFLVESTVLGETRRIHVYTPPGYDEQQGERFPVLYMLDGGMAEDFPHVADAIHAGITWKTVRPVLVVGIENTERRRDLAGPTEVEAERKMAPHAGGSDAFRAFLRQELMPEVRARFRAGAESAIVGESLAGLFVVETFLMEPDLFDTYIAFSPSLWWNGQHVVRHAAERLAQHGTLRARLYLTTADEDDIVSSTEQLVRALEAAAPAGVTWSYHPMPDQFHDTIYRASAPRAFRTLFAAKPGAE